MHLARDENGDLCLFNERPQRDKECWWAEAGVDGTYLTLDKALCLASPRMRSPFRSARSSWSPATSRVHR